MQQTSSYVRDIRAASRDLVRQFGFMNHTIAGTDLSASAVHAIIEISNNEKLSSKQLSDLLCLEKSTVCRMVKALIKRGEVSEERSPEDGRVKYLFLTDRGLKTLNGINDYAEAQVTCALDPLEEPAKQGILNGLRDYSLALKSANSQQINQQIGQKIVQKIVQKIASRPSDAVKIGTGYTPALTARVVEMLIPYMGAHMGFGAAFEARVASDLAQFILRAEAPQNEIWHARIDDKIVGSITIDGDSLGAGLAHLRWFVVDTNLHSNGVGKALLAKALEFCNQQNFRETHLWTVKGLDAARNLYERNGFQLAEEFNGDQWGSEVVEHKFVRKRAHATGG